MSEVDTGGKWVDGRPIYRKVIDFGALPNATTKSVNHGITNFSALINVTGVQKVSPFRSIPYTPASGFMIITASSSQISVQCQSNESALNVYLFMLYVKT